MPAFVTFVTAGYPTSAMTVDVMLSMEAGGADVIELGVPFSDPIADGPAIQESNVVRSLWSLCHIEHKNDTNSPSACLVLYRSH